MNRSNATRMLRIFGIVIFVFIVLNIDLAATFQILAHVNTVFLTVAVVLIFPQIIMRAWRWQLLMKMQSITYSLKDASTVYFAGLFIGTITPGRLGDFIKVQYLRNAGHSMGKSFLSVLIDRLFDLASLILIGYVSLLGFMQWFSLEIHVLSALLLVAPPVLTLLFATGRINQDLCIRLATPLVPTRYRAKIESNLHDFFHDLTSMDGRIMISAGAITFAVWGLYFVMAYFFALSLHIDISFWYLAACTSISALITLIPISISGIGTRDATFITLFSLIGINKESAIAFSMMILLMYLINGSIGFVAWQKNPVAIS